MQLAYDPLGRLSWTTGSPNFTRFLYDGDALVAEYDYAGTTMIKRYAHWVGQPAPAEAGVPMVSYEGASLENAMGRWLIADHQGSIIAAALPSGATAWVNTYDEYGIPGAGNSGRFQYTGQIWLPELGMYHYKARVYSPTLGRFLQTDPVGYEDQFSLYAYVGNDPVNGTDPTGMFRFEYRGFTWDRERLQAAVKNVARANPEFMRKYQVMERSSNVHIISPTNASHPVSTEIPNNIADSRNGRGTGSEIYLSIETITLHNQGISGQDIPATLEDNVAHGVFGHGFRYDQGTSPEPMIDPVTRQRLPISPDEIQALAVENEYRQTQHEPQRARYDSPVPWDDDDE